MVSFTKFGSCVTRDIFNFLDYERYNINSNIMINVVTLLDKACLNIDDKYIVADSNYEKKVVKSYFNNNLLIDSSDYFVFDLAMERLPLQIWEFDGVKKLIPVTWNTYRTGKKIMTECEKSSLKISDWHLADRSMEEYKKQLIQFTDMVKSKYESQKIIYLSIRQAQEFIDPQNGICNFDDHEGKGIEKRGLRLRQDEIIGRAEKIVLDELPDIWKIELPVNAIADTRHHFDLHTLHFNHLVYEYLADCISLIAKNRDEMLSPDEIRKMKWQIDFRKKYAEIRLEELRKIFENKDV